MGAGVGDYDGDGWLDIVRTNFTDQVTTLYRNNGDGTFHDASMQAGLGINRKYVGFGVGFFDFDNDGWQGYLHRQRPRVSADRRPEAAHLVPAAELLYRNLGNGRFEDVSAKAGAAITASRTSAAAVRSATSTTTATWTSSINNLDGPPSLLRNDGGNANNWLLVKCVGTRSNRSAIGARVRVTAGGRRRSTK